MYFIIKLRGFTLLFKYLLIMETQISIIMCEDIQLYLPLRDTMASHPYKLDVYPRKAHLENGMMWIGIDHKHIKYILFLIHVKISIKIDTLKRDELICKKTDMNF